MQRFRPKNIGPDMRGAGPELVLGRAIIEDYSDSRVLDRLMLYERRIESSLHKNMRELERRQIIRQYQQQEADEELPAQEPNQLRLAPSTAGGSITDFKKQSQPSAGNPKRVKENTELKKQSQLSVTNIGANSMEKGGYDNNSSSDDGENKANKGQLQAITSDREIGKREKSCSKLTGLPAKASFHR